MRKDMDIETINVHQESFSFFDSKGRKAKFTDQLHNPSEIKSSDLSETDFEFKIDELPTDELTEIVCKDATDSMYALSPILSRLCEQNRWITLIAPPANLDKKLFALYGIDVSRVLLIHPKNIEQEISIVNNVLKHGKSGIVIYWSSNVPNRFIAQWRKSVKQGNCTGVWVNLSGKSSSSLSVAVTANIVSTNKYVKVINNKQFGKETMVSCETVLPKLNLELFNTSNSQRHLHH